MPGKRKRVEGSIPSIGINNKPLSAIAAARLRAEATTKDLTTPEITHTSTISPLNLPSNSPVVTYKELEADVEDEGQQEEKTHTENNYKLCDWRNVPKNILSDTASELTVNLHKHSTIALIGCFELKVQKGAVNINGANIGTVSPEGQKNILHRVSVSAAHPILKIRGLDGTNHVQFVTCKVFAPLVKMSSLFANIWHTDWDITGSRSFSVVS